MSTHIFVIALHENGRIILETYETVAFACEISESRPVAIVLSGSSEIESLTDELAGRTGLDVVGLSGDHLTNYSAEAYVKSLDTYLKDKGPVHVCIPHTSQGADFAPQLSIKTGACCITAIEGISGDSFARSVFGGKFKAFHKPSSPQAVLTILPGAWKPWNRPASHPGKVQIMPSSLKGISTRPLGIRQAVHANTSLTEAEVIVSAGRGVGKKENISILEQLSLLFAKSAVGSTRAVCDLGWLDYTHQIGTTGNKVSPKLYIACGISGAAQHIAGMKDSRIIIAINTDAHAAIFNVAHYCIVEDVNTFLPILIDAHDKE